MGTKETRPAKRIQSLDLTGLDKLTKTLIKGEELSEAQEKYFDELLIIWELLTQNPKRIVRANLVKRLGISSRDASRVMTTAEDFFGDTVAVSVTANRAKQLLWLEGIILNENTPVAMQIRAIEQHAKISGTLQHGQTKETEPQALPPLLIGMNAPALASPGPEVNPEETDFEEVEEA